MIFNQAQTGTSLPLFNPQEDATVDDAAASEVYAHTLVASRAAAGIFLDIIDLLSYNSS